MDKISIAMTTYNGEKFVEKQLLSLLNQTRKADEVVILDDCSTDKTAEIVSEFICKNSLSNWIFSVNESNVGYKRNFYNTIAQTSGDIIFLCDQDDIWMSEKLDEMEKIFQQNFSILAVSSAFNFIDGEDKAFQVKQSSNKANHNLIKFKISQNEVVKIDLKTICNYNISPGCTCAFKKQIKDIYLEKTECKVVHDWEINFIAACLDGLYFYNHPLIQYRIHTSNTIGLNTVVDGTSIKKFGNYYVRLSKSKSICESLNSFKNYLWLMTKSDVETFYIQRKFTYDRFNAINQKSVLKILKLYRYNGNYKDSVTLQGRLADIACTILPVRKVEVNL